jgi:hypothetical protein
VSGMYQQNDDGTWSPAAPIGWQEEHNALARFVLWLRGLEHCNDREGQKHRRFRRPT